MTEGNLPVAYIYPYTVMAMGRYFGVTGSSGVLAGGVGVGFLESLCGDGENPGNVDTLARAMVHESMHVCKVAEGIDVPGSNDGPMRNWSGLNPWPFAPDAKDLTDECFGSVK